MIKNRGRGSGQGGCERRIKVFVLKKIGQGGWVLGLGFQCEIKKNVFGVRGLGGGVRVDVNEDLKFL